MKYFIWLLLISTALYGCSKDEDTAENQDGTKTQSETVQLTGNALTGTIEAYHDAIKLGQADGVIVELLNEKNKVIKSASSDINGNFYFDNLPTGTYSISISKKGYFIRGSLNEQIKYYTFEAEDEVITLAPCAIYKKSTASVSSIKWYQGTNNGKSDGVHMDIVFEDLDLPAGEKYVYIYMFAGSDANVSKTNFIKELVTMSGSKKKGYLRIAIPRSKMTGNKIADYRADSFCSWRGLFDELNIKPMPTHYAIYVTNTINTSDYFIDLGDNYSGIGDKVLVVRDFGKAL